MSDNTEVEEQETNDKTCINVDEHIVIRDKDTSEVILNQRG